MGKMNDNTTRSKCTDLDVYIGKRVKLYRIQKNLTLKQVSAILGVTIQQLVKYETGKNRISAVNLLKISNALNVKPECLYGTDTSLEHNLIDSEESMFFLNKFYRIKNLKARSLVSDFLDILARA